MTEPWEQMGPQFRESTDDNETPEEPPAQTSPPESMADLLPYPCVGDILGRG